MESERLDIQCWRCGLKLAGILLPFSRLEECPHCNSDLHTCKACKHFSPSLTSSCNEDRADFISERENANFCDFFIPSPASFRSSDRQKSGDARAKLAELFGETPDEQAPASSSSRNEPLSDADKALAELKRLFGDD
jgi:hypothetical protein